jgi:hypothetical protein
MDGYILSLIRIVGIIEYNEGRKRRILTKFIIRKWKEQKDYGERSLHQHHFPGLHLPIRNKVDKIDAAGKPGTIE